MWIAINGLLALLSLSGAAFAWVWTYDGKMRLNRLETNVKSLRGNLGQMKGNFQKEAREAVQQVAPHPRG